jgi:hypothetical protein
MNIKLEAGKTYIVRGKMYNRHIHIKYLIEEITEYTILILNMDSSGINRERMSIEDFNTKYDVLELIIPATDKILKNFNHGDV